MIFENSKIKIVKKGILTIDASPAISYLINTILGKEFSVTSVNNCKDAIHHLHSDLNNEVVILDVSDVESENMDLLEHFNTSAVFRNIKTVVISNSDNESLKDKTVQLGASLFLTKPFDPIFLSIIVKEMVSTHDLPVIEKRKNNFSLNIF